jgi:sec-independent protein translocase protein TatC
MTQTSTAPTAFDQAAAPFMDHLMELRARLLMCILAVAVTTGLSLIFYNQLIEIVQRPLRSYNQREVARHEEATAAVQARIAALQEQIAEEDTAARRRELAQAQAELEELGAAYAVQLLPDGTISGFIGVVKLGLWCGLIFALPMIVTQLWLFVSPGLHAHERRAIGPVFVFGALLFLLGAAMAYFYVLPTGLDYLYGWNKSWNAAPVDYISKYMGFVTSLLLAFGLAFELPVIILALTGLGLVEPRWLLAKWRYAVVLAVTLGALLTPPDPLSQLILGSCLILLYIISIGLSLIVYRRKEVETEAAE